jgi:hypothetical protein
LRSASLVVMGEAWWQSEPGARIGGEAQPRPKITLRGRPGKAEPFRRAGRQSRSTPPAEKGKGIAQAHSRPPRRSPDTPLHRPSAVVRDHVRVFVAAGKVGRQKGALTNLAPAGESAGSETASPGEAQSEWRKPTFRGLRFFWFSRSARPIRGRAQLRQKNDAKGSAPPPGKGEAIAQAHPRPPRRSPDTPLHRPSAVVRDHVRVFGAGGAVRAAEVTPHPSRSGW